MKTSVYIATSLDGFIARENGALDWLPGSDGDNQGNGEDFGYHQFMESVDMLVMGRNTYEMVLSFGEWPYGEKRVIVLSSKKIEIPENLSKTVASRSCSPIELVDELLKSGAKHLYIDGGKTIQGFLNAGLIQKMIITQIPILIGSGIPLFGELDRDKKLRLIKSHALDSGFVQSKYEVLE
ncbi:MAG: dihydrofolate reductase [Anaerolineae bacterium]|nr:dihydrofolate reductase [Anaerolineae bacterium]MBT3713067.1 dihydrofolate reductase [Anaerolineae bacterium]MBT4309676.1 dihydrofolate reductase [Anaerolineae bacterium]MBT4459430.1 dihydrofolate reductase [Anaerolineae bacterium]MBT4842030.1 dihydrofolate reductase [Anaerolineae bacterium]